MDVAYLFSGGVRHAVKENFAFRYRLRERSCVMLIL